MNLGMTYSFTMSIRWILLCGMHMMPFIMQLMNHFLEPKMEFNMLATGKSPKTKSMCMFVGIFSSSVRECPKPSFFLPFQEFPFLSSCEISL